MIKLVGIAGKAKAGKDTLGSYLVRNLGYKRMAFADPLKEAMAAAFGIPLAEFHGEDLKDEVHPYWGITRRAVLQRGADALRGQFGQDLFIRVWTNAYCNLPEQVSVVVTDIRSDAEAETIRSLCGRVIRLTRSSSELNGLESQHHTENGISDCLVDLEIGNNGTKDEMFQLVSKILRGLE